MQSDLSKVERPIVFFHDGCITHDGWMSAFLAKLRWPDAELVAVQYGCEISWPSLFSNPGNDFVPFRFKADGKERTFDFAGRDVLIVDFSFSRSILQAIRERARSLLVLDHHKTAAKDLEGLDYCVFDMERSGAGLALDHFFPEARTIACQWLDWLIRSRDPRNGFLGFITTPDDRAKCPSENVSLAALALLIEDYDLWRFRDPKTRAVGVFLETIPKEFDAWMALDMNLDRMADLGRTIMSYRAGLVESIARNAYVVPWPEGLVLAVNTPLFRNEVADLLLRRDPEAVARCRKTEEIPETPAGLRAVVSWYRHEDGGLVCSIRSHPDGVDCSALAKKRGGGGHARSAGFKVSAEELADADIRRAIGLERDQEMAGEIEALKGRPA
jgi:uncharacterized protein